MFYFLFNLFPSKPWFLHVCSISLLKTLWEKEKLLVTSNFSFSYSVFYPFGELSVIFITFEIVSCKLFQFGRVYNLSFGKGSKSNNVSKKLVTYCYHHYRCTQLYKKECCICGENLRCCVNCLRHTETMISFSCHENNSPHFCNLCLHFVHF